MDPVSAVLALVSLIFILAESVNHFQKTPPEEDEIASWALLQILYFILGVVYFLVPSYIGYWMFNEYGLYVGWLIGFRIWWAQFDDGTD